MTTAHRIEVTVGTERTTALVYVAEHQRRHAATLVLAHGAGAGQQHPFMVRFATGLASRGVDVVTFNFLYTERRRKVPDRTPALEECFRAVAAMAQEHEPLAGNALFIGGKSMGGRMATHLAADDVGHRLTALKGVVLLGYPLHPPGKPEQLRVSHFPKIAVPLMFVQGTRDPFGSPSELEPHVASIPSDVTIHTVEHGDHSLAVPKSGPRSVAGVYDDVQDTIARWIERQSPAV